MPEDADAPAARQGRHGVRRFPASLHAADRIADRALALVAGPNAHEPGVPRAGRRARHPRGVSATAGALRLPCLRRSCLHVTASSDGASFRPPRYVGRGFRWRKRDQCRTGFGEGEKMGRKFFGFVVLATPPQPLPTRGRGLSRLALFGKT
jgi:hypothetical protein